MRKTLRGPDGIRVELDTTEVIPSDPGAGCPAVVYVGRYSGTLWCALDTGYVDTHTITDRQYRWLDSIFEEADTFLYGE